MLLSENNIKSELSYAYLHAVAARAGMGCDVAGRHTDGDGVDATLRVRERLAPDSTLLNFAVDVQLKATSRAPVLQAGRYSHTLTVPHYDRLRIQEVNPPRLLFVLFLPGDPGRWLTHSEQELITRRCAYWVSLWGAPASGNTGAQTVYIPEVNVLSADTLRTLMTRLSREERIAYAP